MLKNNHSSNQSCHTVGNISWKKMKFLIYVSILFCYLPAMGQFTEMTPNIDSVEYSSVDWGDFDGDGDLDILIAGAAPNQADSIVTKVFENTGSGSFTNINAGLTGIYDGQVQWWDYNNDNFPDIILAGMSDTSYVVKLYKNNRTGGFEPDSTILSEESNFDPFAIADINNDRLQDIVFNEGSSGRTRLYENLGNGSFKFKSRPTGDDVSRGDLVFGDYDNDGDPDLLTGEGDLYYVDVLLYENTGQGDFKDPIRLNCNLATSCSDLEYVNNFEWNDFNNDGNSDILINYSYFSSSSVIQTRILLNDGKGSFNYFDVAEGFETHPDEQAKSGDFNNDGYVDVLVTGYDFPNSQQLTRLYQNDGDTTFTDFNLAVDSVSNADIAWGDYDNDRDLDLFLTGMPADGTPVTKIYRNDMGIANTLPPAPTNLQAQANPGVVTLSWSPADDAESSAEGVNYNIWVSPTSAPSDTFIVSPLANDSTSSGQHGKRYVVDQGNVGKDTSHTLSRLPAGTYYWSVQAIDGAYAGSPFAAEETFTAPEKNFRDTLNTNFIQQDGDVSWADFDGDGDLDALVVGQDTTALYENDGSGSFVPTDAVFTSLLDKNVSWCDVDNDGDMDLFSNNILYINQGSGNFSEVYIPTNQGLHSRWGDYDNDGYPDLLSYDLNDAGVYHNNGDNTFSTSIWSENNVSSADWGDFDNDGDLDIVYTDNNNISLAVSQNGSITNAGDIADIGGTTNVLWGDANNDGYLDVLYMDRGDSTGVLMNNGNGTFTNETITHQQTGMGDEGIKWGDVDNDGYPDVLITDYNNNPGEPSTRIYLNQGDGSFTFSLTGIQSLDYTSVAFGDADNDGDLDLLIAGRDADNKALTKVYVNDAAVSNTPPSAPANPDVTYLNDDQIQFSWDAATDNETPQQGLSYNLKIGTSPDSLNIKAPMADTATGYRYIADEGKVAGTSWIMQLDPDSVYYWQVQAIDAAFAGGIFSAMDSFDINSPPKISIPNNRIDLNELETYYIDYVTPLQVTDTDIGSNDMEIKIFADTGRISLNDISNLQFFYGDGTEDDSIHFEGPLSAVNNSLDSLMYHAPTYNGFDTLMIVANDQGATGTGPSRADTGISRIQINKYPVLDNPMPDQITKEDSGYITIAYLDTVFSDPADDNLSYSIHSYHITADISNDTLRIKPEQDYFGTDTMVVEAHDHFDSDNANYGEYASTYDTVLVTVTPVNDPPVFTTVPVITMDEDDSVTIDLDNYVKKDDPDSLLQYQVYFVESWVDTNYALTLNDTTNELKIKTNPHYNGTDSIEIWVTDTAGYFDVSGGRIEITPVNDPPAFVNLPDSVTLHCADPVDTINLYDVVEDPELPDSALFYQHQQDGRVNITQENELLIVQMTVDNINRFEYEQSELTIGTRDSTHSWSSETVHYQLQNHSYNSNTIIVEACDSYTVPSGDETYNVSKIILDTLPNAYGCDSIFTIDLRIPNITTYIDPVNNTLHAGEPDIGTVTYQWLDCTNDTTPIEGENDQIFSPDSDGRYAVAITKDGCTDTSICYTYGSVGIQQNTFGHAIEVYPNPTPGQVTLDMDTNYAHLDVQMTDMAGNIVREQTFREQDRLDLNIPGEAGTYMIMVRSRDQQQAIIKVLKE